MLFNSFSFLIFFPVVTSLYYLLPHKLRWSLLLTASCIFYMFFIPKYILILFFTIIVDYVAGILIEKKNAHKKLFLIASIIANVGVLCFFKYFNFLNTNIDMLAHAIGWNYGVENLKIILPIGLSFHTFQAMSYIIEVYRGNQKAEKHLGIYALYVMFYPQLVAGPIERPQNILHQLHEKHPFDWNNVISGLRLMLWGLFKKIVIADRIAGFVNPVYGNPDQYHGWATLLVIFFFAFQIYTDFSGYSDIALGSTRVMGIELMTNFNSPFISRNITEFWRRWHISLSTWFNDYVFIPIATALRDWGKMAVTFALLVTFFLSGLWHGAGWNFIIYGCMHGVAMVIEFYTKKQRKKLARQLPSFAYDHLSNILTITFVALSWVFFRSPDFSTTKAIFSACLNLNNYSTNWFRQMPTNMTYDFFLGLFFIVQLLILEYFIRSRKIMQVFRSTFMVRFIFCLYLAFNLMVWGAYRNTYEFIYFQF